MTSPFAAAGLSPPAPHSHQSTAKQRREQWWRVFRDQSSEHRVTKFALVRLADYACHDARNTLEPSCTCRPLRYNTHVARLLSPFAGKGAFGLSCKSGPQLADVRREVFI